MGICGVNVPAIYGEGALAFSRLQEEILKQVPVQTIFVWNTGHSSPPHWAFPTPVHDRDYVSMHR